MRLLFALFLLPAMSLQAEDKTALLAVGKTVPSFYSRVVTGPLKNQSVCFVCRYGNRPAVLVVTRQLSPELKLFLRNVDRIIDTNRAAGLKCFTVYLNDEKLNAVSQVQTFAFNARLTVPLSVGNEGITAPGCLNVAAGTEVAIILYRNRKVLAGYSFKKSELNKAKMKPLLQEILTLVKQVK